ncbi:MAG: MFS transporter [Clostridia bacterium]|nr:MFS transporter [Clostridia bacterium]MBQ4350076.1 MFS transporter [Clostridia bacterium]
MDNYDEKQKIRLATRLVILCWISYTTVYIGKKTLSVCLPDMIADGVCDKAAGGVIGTCFLAAYALGQLVNGWFGDRLHPRFMIPVGLVLAGGMNLCMSVSSSVPLFLVIWGLCGFFCSMLWAPVIRAVSTWTTEKIADESAASLSATIPVGTVLCYLLCALMLKHFGWRAAFAACGAVLVVMGVLLYFLFRTLKDFTKEPEAVADDGTKVQVTAAPVKTLLCLGLLAAAGGILFNGMLKDGLDLWIPTALNERFIPDSSTVSLICTILPLVNIFGAYAAKFVMRRCKIGELGTCAVMFAVSAVTLGLFLVFLRHADGGALQAVIATVLLACSSAAMLGANTMLLTFIPLHFGKVGRAAFVTGVLNSFSYAAAAVSGAVTGAISDTFGWEGVFLGFIGAAVLGALVCFAGRKPLLKKTKELDELQR